MLKGSSILKANLPMTQIIECFSGALPDSIIVGGSYTTNEQNITSYAGTEYWLSDIDLLCVRDKGFLLDEIKQIYQRMLVLSSELDQKNPYFHIGLKLRSTKQLSKEVDSLYFRELSEESFSILGKNFLEYFDNDQKFGFFSKANQLNQDITSVLISCAITRLWCNVLFFPAILFKTKSTPHELWYNYFFSRGCLDWVTWCLIENASWVSGYENRHLKWLKSNHPEKWQVKLMNDCLDTKLGKKNVDYKKNISPALQMAFSYMADLGVVTEEMDQEIEFVKSMNRYIESKANGSASEILSWRHIDSAKISLDLITGIDNVLNANQPSEISWLRLREIYSNFRFSRNKQDCIDHEVYTEHFLSIGSKLTLTKAPEF